MKKLLKIFSAALVCSGLFTTNVMASSHREAPLISNDPLADNTDLYAFRSPCDNSKIVFIANYIPFEHPAGGPNWYTFGENIRYELHIDNNTATKGDDIIYRFTFQQVNEDPTTFFNIRLGKQNVKTTYTMERSTNGGSSFSTIITDGVVPPPNIGPRSIEGPVGLGATSYKALMQGAIKTTNTGEKVFCGPIDDPFFVDLGGAFDLGGFRQPGRDGVAKFNCHSICIEVPISTLQKDGKTAAQAANILDGDFVIGVYASASRQRVTMLEPDGAKPSVNGQWIQVSRLGMPLTNEAVIPLAKKDLWNASNPADDLQFAEFFKNPELALYMDDSQFGTAVPGLSQLRIQTNSLGAFDFRNGKKGLYDLKGSAAVAGTALDDAIFGTILLPDDHSPRAVDLLPIFYTGVPNLAPYQLATGKGGNPLAAGKPFINNFLPTLGDYLRLNMAVPVTPRNDPKFSPLGIVAAAALGLTDPAYNTSAALQFIPNMDGFPNGRRLEDDVTTIELQAVSGVALAAIGLWYDDYPGNGSPVTQQLVNVLSFNAGVTKNDTTFQDCFPYVQEPWRGFRGPSYTGPVTCDAVGSTLYVDASAAGGNGSSWKCAMKELSAAVAIANGNVSIKAIWVAKGTYKPTTGNSRAMSMQITRADLKIIGGFAGTESSADDADPTMNSTIITGDIGTMNDASDNSYHLFTIRNLAANANPLMIKGFTMEHGNANVAGSGNNYGGAILLYSNNAATPIHISWCKFHENASSSQGGAVYADRTTVNFMHCMFTNNSSANGGAYYGFNSSSSFDKAVFANNMASISGGASYTNFGTPVFSKVIFSMNSSAVEGGAVYQNQAGGKYYNTVFDHNSSMWSGAIHQHNASTSSIVNSTFYFNSATNGAGAGAIILAFNNCTASVQNSIFYNNWLTGVADIPNADIKNTYNTPITVQSTDLQLNSKVPMDNGTSIANNKRGIKPLFVNEFNPMGADMMWFTSDDGLALMNTSPLRNMGSNAAASAASLTQDIVDMTRVACGTVDMGAYENQNCLVPNRSNLAPNATTKTEAIGIVENPFRSQLQVRYYGDEPGSLNVFDASGKVMSGARALQQGINRVDADNWNKGMYQVIIQTKSGKKMTFKVMKM